MAIALTVAAVRPKIKAPTESILFACDFTPLLRKTTARPPVLAETISSVTIAQSHLVAATALTIGAGAANAATFNDDEGGIIAIGAAGQFRISGGTAGYDYTLTVTVTTSDSNTRVCVCTLQVRAS